MQAYATAEIAPPTETPRLPAVSAPRGEMAPQHRKRGDSVDRHRASV
jgi:hypothetical protein